MKLAEQFLWIIYPYIVLSIFILGLLLRYNNDQRGLTTKSSEILEKKLLKLGAPLFHGGIIFAFFGHIGGLLVPLSFYKRIGVPDEQYHLMATILGGLSGAAASIGIGILLYRRFMIKRISVTSSVSDRISIVVLAIVIALGMLATFSPKPEGFEYRASIGPWLRGVLTFRPDVALMSQVPLIFKFHIFGAFTFFALMPFTRMMHIFSQPIMYLKRSYILYRKRS